MTTPANRNQIWFVADLIPRSLAYWQSMADKLAAGAFTEDDVDESLRRAVRQHVNDAEAATLVKIKAAERAEQDAIDAAAVASAAAEAGIDLVKDGPDGEV